MYEMSIQQQRTMQVGNTATVAQLDSLLTLITLYHNCSAENCKQTVELACRNVNMVLP